MNLRLAKCVLVTAVLLILLTDDTDAWRRRRRRRCWRACQWGHWSAWGPCSATCGTSGTQTRARGHAVTAQCGGTPCSGPTSQTQACNRKCCPQNCVWYNWGSWSACTATCGSSGIKDRTRGRTSPYCGGLGCTGEAREVLPCNRRCCPRNCQWHSWGSWSSCSPSCGSSRIRTRTRSKTTESCGGTPCSGSSTDRDYCGSRCCPQNCRWGSWGSWGSCSASCERSGTQTRTRREYTEYCGGRPCSGSDTDTRSCMGGCCRRNCRWGDWSSWGTCTAPCGNTGTHTRTRTIAVSASCGGSSCTGDASETNPCNRHCPHGSPNGLLGCNCAGTGYGGTCCDIDIDECSGSHNCHQHANCTNTVGSYRCECNSGYTGNGRTCTALCRGSTTCPHGGICSSPNHCTSCDSGYESPDCGNIDECAMDTDNCHAKASCSDTDGSFTCTCSDGYTGSGLHCERNAPNLVYCPADTRITVNSPSGGILDWTDPEFRFQPSNELANHECSADKGDAAPIGTHSVQCWAEGFADATTCDFDVIIEAPECVIPAPPRNGAVTCGVAEGAQKYCSLSCQNRYDFATEPADTYRCDWYAVWHPAEDLPWPDCSRSYRPGRARQKNELYYHTGSCAFNEEDIKRDLLLLYATLGDCSAGIRCGISDIEVTCGLSSRKRRDAPKDTELREHNDDLVVKRSTLGHTVKIKFVTEAESLAEEPTADDQSEVIGALDDIYFEIRARVAARTFDLDIGGVMCEAVNYVGFLPSFDLQCEDGQIEKVETFGAVCINCPVGTHEQDNTCLPCPPGWYQDEEAQTECKACPSEGSAIEGCDKEPDHCHFSPCQNGGTCHDFVGFYNCTCPDAFTGDDCEEDADECDLGTDTCHDAANCTNAPGSYNCTCNDGYKGDGYNCVDVDECALEADTCDEDATCNNIPGSYTCDCNPGYTGDGITCTDTDECASDPCQNGGTCHDEINGYTCTCAPGYVGDDCETDVDECASVPCENGGTCEDEVNGYTCTCAAGYFGDYCEIGKFAHNSSHTVQ
ncbi:fibropellin-1-like [Branchiostoma lanceolatum]|uniref:fibropellin-1-like n=1 Tax=Branchiostoma lanceolatum TaxID=7740 RepID=UPI003454C832